MKKKINENNFQWYIVSVVTGNENLVINNLWGKIEAYGLANYVSEIKTIKDETIEETIYSEDNLPINYGRNTKNIRWETFKDANGNTKFKKIKKVVSNRFQGYIFIKMILNDEVWFAIRNTQLITGIVGSCGKNTKPIPVSDDEIINLLENNSSHKQAESNNDLDNNQGDLKVTSEVKHQTYSCDFSVGQNVKVINGPFKDSIGIVKAIDKNRGFCLITINLFGRDTDAEISFEDVQLDK